MVFRFILWNAFLAMNYRDILLSQWNIDIRLEVIILVIGGVVMDKSTKDVIIGAVISGAFLIIATCIEILPSININIFNNHKFNTQFINSASMNVLSREINEIRVTTETAIVNNGNQSYVIDSQEILGVWSGSYIGTSNNKKLKKEIQLYIGACGNNGNVQGIAEIESGEAGYYYWEGTLDFTRGIMDFERKKWISTNPDHLKKIKYIMMYEQKEKKFNGYITKDPSRTIQLFKAGNDEKLKKLWEKREELIKIYN